MLKKNHSIIRSTKRHIPTLRLLSLKHSIDYEIMQLYEKIKYCKDKNIDYHDHIQIEDDHLFEIIHYILKKKSSKSQFEISVITFYLSQFSSLTSILKYKKDQIDSAQMYHKLSLFLQIEFYSHNRIICVNGQKGNKFYMILKGHVAILIPTSYHIDLTVDEYLLHLNTLKQFHEYDLIKRTNDSNHYSYMHLYLIDDPTSKNKGNNDNNNEEVGQCNTNNNNLEPEAEECTVENYINRIIPTHKEEDNRREHLYYNRNSYINDESYRVELMRKTTKTFILWKYQQICDLKTGDSFGDIALKEENNFRTATIISLEESFFGTLTRDAYNICLKDAQEKIRKIKLTNILSNQLFDGFYPKIFEKYYFNYFKSIEFDRGNMIFNQGEQRKEIYFLIDGEIRLSTKSSLSYFGNIIESLDGEKCDDKDLLFIQRKKILYPDLLKFYQRVKEFRIYGMKQKEIFGLDDCIITDYNTIINDNDNDDSDSDDNGGNYIGKDIYFCSACVMSHKCELYALEIDLFKKILSNEKSVRISNINLQKDRKKMMVNRLISIKDITIQSYCNTVKNNIQLNDNNKIENSNITARNLPKLQLEFSMSIDNNTDRSKHSSNNIKRKNHHTDVFYPIKTQLNHPIKLSTTHNKLVSFDTNNNKNYTDMNQGVMITTSSFIPNMNIMKRLVMIKEEEKNKESINKSTNFNQEIRKLYAPSLQYESKAKLLQKDIKMYNNVVDKLLDSYLLMKKNKDETKMENQYTQYQKLHDKINKKHQLDSIAEKANITSIDCLIFDKYIEQVESPIHISTYDNNNNNNHIKSKKKKMTFQKYYRHYNKKKHRHNYFPIQTQTDANTQAQTQSQMSPPHLHHYPIA